MEQLYLDHQSVWSWIVGHFKTISTRTKYIIPSVSPTSSARPLNTSPTLPNSLLSKLAAFFKSPFAISVAAPIMLSMLFCARLYRKVYKYILLFGKRHKNSSAFYNPNVNRLYFCICQFSPHNLYIICCYYIW